MANDSANTKIMTVAARVSLSPTTSTSNIKRDRSDEENPTRRVLQRTEGVSSDEEEAAEDWKTSMETILMTDLWKDDEDVLEMAMGDLVDILYADDDEKRSEKQKLFF